MSLKSDQNLFKSNILAFPKQLSFDAIKAGNMDILKKAVKTKKPDSICFIGMGGSGTPGSILQNILDCAIVGVPVVTWKDSGLPQLPFKNPLYIFVSFSGNTRETLDGFTKAVKAKKLVAVVAGGGTLLEQAQAKQLPHATFSADSTLQPRQAYGLTLYATLQILKSVFPRLHIPDLSAQIDSDWFAKRAEKTAARMSGKTVLAYSTQSLSHLGQIVKISITETGKTLAFANTIPEVNHNELNLIETKPKNIYALFITSEAEYTQRQKEFELTAATLDEYGIASETIQVPGKTPLEITANGIAMAQWIGLETAKRINRNPLGLEVVNKIKDLAKQKSL